MKYGDMVITNNENLEQLDKTLTGLAVEIQLEKESADISEEEFREILAEQNFDVNAMSDWDFKDRYADELKSRAKNREIFAERIDEIKEDIAKQTKDLPKEEVDKFLSERKKHFDELKLHLDNNLEIQDAVVQRQATAAAQQVVYFQRRKESEQD